MLIYVDIVTVLFCFNLIMTVFSDVSLNKKAKQQVAETMNNENKKPDPSKDVHLQALKIFINLFRKGNSCNVNHRH